MRYLLAIIGAIVGALGVTIMLSPMVANWVVGASSFDSPDQVSNFEDVVFLATSVGGLILGWVIGWGIAAALGLDNDADEAGN
ncbi:MAG: hypothetical protein ACRBCJ_08180 [Hyphomicrobiaceae bacterium]